MKLTVKQAILKMKKNNGNLDLSGTAITSLPDNLTVGGYLNLRGTAITSLPDNLTVGGSLDLSGTAITSLPDNLTVGGYLNLRGTAITSLPDNLTVGGSLDLSGTAITSLPKNLTVGGWLDLSGTAITSLSDNLTVGGNLYLRDTGITSLPDNLTVGGILYLSDTKITSLSDNLTVGGWIESNKISSKKKTAVKKLKNGDYQEGNYLYADGILTHVKKCKQINAFTYYIGKFKNNDVIFDGVNYAHCKNFKSGVADLMFKKAKNRGSDQYKDLSLSSSISKEDAITMYRVLTGACALGTEKFVNGLSNLKNSYTVNEIITLTKGQHGAEIFKKFFSLSNA